MEDETDTIYCPYHANTICIDDCMECACCEIYLELEEGVQW